MGQSRDNRQSSSTDSQKDVLLVTQAHLADRYINGLNDTLAKQHPRIHIEHLGDRTFEEVSAETLQATKYLLGFNRFPTPEQVPNLEFVQLFSAGANHLKDHPLFKWRQDEVKWGSASGVHGPIIGEYVVMAVLTHFHQYLSHVDSFQGDGHWPEKQGPFFNPQKELYEQTVGIVGYGAIGRNVAKLLTGFNVNVTTLNASRKEGPGERQQKETFTVPGTGDLNGDIPSKWYSSNDPQDKKEFFETSDVVVVTAPLTHSTRHLVDAKAIGQMKKTAFVVNIARGELIDQDALISALEKKEIGGAALDVITPEPYPSDGELLTKFRGKEDRDRVILTPHVSGHTDKYNDRVLEIFYENINRLESGKPLLNVISVSRGY